MPVGAYHPGWPDIHMNPEEAVRAHRDVTDPGKGLLVPIHWGTFRLAPHPWSNPSSACWWPPATPTSQSRCRDRANVWIRAQPPL